MSFLRRMISHQAINVDVGLLIIRVGVGLSTILFHGYGKLLDGPERWAKVGGNMANLGITFAPTFWGFMAAFIESFGAAFLILGFLFRPAAGLLAFVMLVAMLRHLNLPADASGAGWKGASHALELFVVFVGLLLTGPGRHTIMSFFGAQNDNR